MTDDNQSNPSEMWPNDRPPIDEIVSALCDANWLQMSADERQAALISQLEKLDEASRIAAIDQQWIDALLHQLSAAADIESRRRVDRLMQTIRRREFDSGKPKPGQGASVPLFLPEAPDDGNPLTGSPATASGVMGWLGSSALAWALVSVLLVAVAWFSWREWSGAKPTGLAQPHLATDSPASEMPTAPATLPERAQVSIGRVDRLDSQVIIERDGAKQNAVIGMEILASDSLDVPAGGGVELTLADQSQARLGPRTMLAFASAREAMLREGFVQIDARNRRESAPLAITTPDATTQIRDAWLSMGADRKRTQIRVAEGSVLAARRTDGMEVEIPQGYCSTIARAVGPDPRRSCNGTALFVVSAKALHAHEDWERFDQILAERIVGDRLWRSAMPVRMRTYDELQADDLKDCSLIVLSIFPEKAGVEQKLIDLKVPELTTPIVCLESTGFPVLGMTGPTLGKDFGMGRGPLVVDIIEPNHPLAAGFVGKGLELFAFGKAPYWWGVPNANAQAIVRLHKDPGRCLLFAYDRGDLMVGGAAPARRVGLFMIPRGADYDSPGLDLVDAAIDWCLDSASADLMVLVSRATPMLQDRSKTKTLWE